MFLSAPPLGPGSPGEDPGLRLAYVAAEVLVEGHAAFTHATEIIAGLRRRGVDVHVISPERDRVQRSLRQKLWDYVRIYATITSRGRSADCYYVRLHPALFPLIFALHRRGIPVIVEVNGPPSDAVRAHPVLRSIRHIYSLTFLRSLRCASAIVSVTSSLSSWISLRASGVPVRTVPNGANIELFHPDAPRPDGVPQLYALFFGSFAPWQGIETLLAAERRPEWPADVHLLFIGDGALRRTVEEAAAARPRVDYIGVRAYADMAAYVANALCGLSVKDDSVEHISPLKAYETLSCGTPLVASNHASHVEIVSGQEVCGIIVGRADARGTAEAVARLRHDPTAAAEMGRAARRRAASEFSWDRRARDVFELVETVTRSPEPPA